ncbi:hypothetical protein BD626DRAFT_64991 [Schizophyllum amplum]|uniref:Uncharacterized protein n=1 Tax=Schizophyllum amplum TaxID=97359 RepID=A0A550CB56_9AGAR|nr:hypothetical protein BD626DRAFT_64991 [Auriculariopsis ampla]
MPRIKAAYFGKDVKIRRLLVAKPLYLINKELYSSTVPTTISQASSTQGTPSPSPAPAPLTSASETVSTSIAPPPRPRTIDEVREGLVAKFNELDRAFKVVLDCKNDIPTEYHVVVADKLIEALGPSEAEKLFNDADELHEKYAVQGWPFYAGSSPRRLAATFDKAKIAARQLSLRDAALASRAARRARIPNKAPSVGTAGPSTASSAPQYAPASDVSETTCPTEAQGNSEIRDSKRRPPTRSMFSGAVRATTHQSAPRPSARAVMSAVDSPSAAPVVVSSSKAPIAPSTPPSMPLPTPQPAPSSTLPLALPPTLPSASTSANPAVHAKYMPPALQAVAQRQDVYAPGHTVSPTASPYNILTRVPDVPPVIDTSRVDDAPRVDDAQHEGLESNTDDGSLTDKGSDDGSLTDRGSRTDGSSDQGGTCLDDGESSYNGDFADSLYNGGVSDDDDGSDREVRSRGRRSRGRAVGGAAKASQPSQSRVVSFGRVCRRSGRRGVGRPVAGGFSHAVPHVVSRSAHDRPAIGVETTRGPVVEILRRPAVEPPDSPLCRSSGGLSGSPLLRPPGDPSSRPPVLPLWSPHGSPP